MSPVSHVDHGGEASRVTHMYGSCVTYEGVMSHVHIGGIQTTLVFHVTCHK